MARRPAATGRCKTQRRAQLGRRPRSHSATARCHRVTESSIDSPSLIAARAAKRTRPSLQRRRGGGPDPRSSAISPGGSPQTRGPADGRLEGLIESIRVRALRGVQRRPGTVHVTVGDRHERPRQDSRGRRRPTGWQRREPPRYGSPFTAQDGSSTCCSTSRAAWALSPAASACRMASSAKPCSSDQAAAARCSSGTRPGCSAAGGRGAGRRTAGGSATSHGPHPAEYEQARPLDRLQHRLAAGPAGDRIAQRAVQPVQHRGLQQNPRTCSLCRSSTSWAR